MLRKLIIPNLRFYSTSSTATTVDANEMKHFNQFFSGWWDEFGPLKPLHAMNPLRVALIRDGLANTGVVSKENLNTPHPLKNLSLLDVGCGGGILCEPLARMGAKVTGCDPNPNLIESAKTHASLENLPNLQYVSEPIENHAERFAGTYDAVVTSETLEHVTSKEEFLAACVKCLKPGGSIFVTTVNQTWQAALLIVYFAEYVAKIVPQGTHEYNKFIAPHKVERILEDQNCRTILVHGLTYNLLTNKWMWVKDNSVNYVLHAIKLET